MSLAKTSSARKRLAAALGQTFGVRNASLKKAVHRAGKRMPREVRDHLRQLDHIDARIAHPRRRGQVNAKDLKKAQKRSEHALAKIDIAKDRARARFFWFGTLVLNLLVFAIAYSALIYWLGIL